MKKTIMLVLLAGMWQYIAAQDLKKVETLILLGKLEDAKAEVDKAVNDAKQQEKSLTWYWKSRIYAGLSKDEAMRAKYPNMIPQAEAAFKKYESIDTAFELIKSKGADGYFDMYSSTLAAGTREFNDKNPDKKWETAGWLFETANNFVSTIIKNKWSNMTVAFDTTTILYAAYAYQNAKKFEKAAQFYAILANNKVKGTGYEDIYKFLVQHYLETKSEAQFQKYLAIGKEVYPNGEWNEYELVYIEKNLTLDEKVAAYEKGDATGTFSEIHYLQFGDIFVKTKKDEGIDSARQRWFLYKSAEAFKKAYNKNNQNGIAAFNAGIVYYNLYVEYDDKYAANIREMQRINAEKPIEKDPKKKAAAEAAVKIKTNPFKEANAELEKHIIENLDIALEWIGKSYNILKDKTNRSNSEKTVIGKSVDLLTNIYMYKRDKVRGKDDKAFDDFDAKYKEFDALHGKFY